MGRILKPLFLSDRRLQYPRHTGPQAQPIAERELHNLPQPVKRINGTYSKRKKIEVLGFLTHHSIPVRAGYRGPQTEPGYRRPTQSEAAALFKIPQRTISGWWNNAARIVAGGSAAQVSTYRTTVICRWPELEDCLY